MGRADAVHAGLPLGGRGERGLVGKLPGLSGLRGGHLAEVWSQELGRRKAGEMLTSGAGPGGGFGGAHTARSNFIFHEQLHIKFLLKKEPQIPAASSPGDHENTLILISFALVRFD